jgi:hypothetical protein
MNIGKELRELTVEPLEWPAPSPQPEQAPATPAKELVPVEHDA